MFLTKKEGSISLLAALTFGILFVASGIAVDYSDAIRIKKKLQTVVDAATLSVAKVSMNGTDRSPLFRESIEAQLMSLGLDADISLLELTAEETLNSVDLSTRVGVDYHNVMLSGFGLNFQDIQVTATASHVTSNLEIALVLDISSSMWGSKLTSLQDATRSFLQDVMFDDTGAQDDRVAVSIVPYGGGVLLPSDLQSNVSLDSTNQPLFDRSAWTGCIQYKAADFNDGLLELGGAYEVSTSGSGNNQDDENAAGSSGGPTITYTGRYEPVPHHWKWYNGNWWCPKAGNEIMPLTTNYNRLLQTVDQFALSDGTGSDQGVLWGYKMLSPKWRGQLTNLEPNLPANYDETNTTKVMIVMTDGGITKQFKPNDADLQSSQPPYRTYSQGYYGKSAATGYFGSICTQAKENNIVVYAIGFDVPNTTQLAHLTSCATTQNHYFTPDNNGLGEAFDAIATQLNEPRLTS